MVESRVKSTLVLKINGRKLPKLAHGDVSIKWGRSSLFEAPQRRTLQATILLNNSNLNLETINELLGASLEAELFGGTIFIGVLTDATPRRLSREIALYISAQEVYSPGRKPLELVFETNVQSSFMLKNTIIWHSQNHGQNYDNNHGVTFEDPAPDGLRIIRGKPQKTTLRDAIESLVTHKPLAQPAWSPDFKAIRSTISKITHIGAERIALNADQISARHPGYHLDQYPAHITYEVGGKFGDKRVAAQSLLRGGVKGKTVVATSPTSWESFSLDDIGAADDLIKAQTTAPVELIYSDDVTPAKYDEKLYTDWEYPNRYIVIQNIPPNNELLTSKSELSFVAIGGELTFTPTKTSHKIISVYVSRGNDRPTTSRYREANYRYRDTDLTYNRS